MSNAKEVLTPQLLITRPASSTLAGGDGFGGDLSLHCWSFRQKLTNQGESRQAGGRIKSCLVVVVSVIEGAADEGANDSGHAPGCKQQTIVDTGVPRSPEIRSRDAVD